MTYPARVTGKSKVGVIGCSAFPKIKVAPLTMGDIIPISRKTDPVWLDPPQDGEQLLYNSRIVSTYVEYLHHHRTDIDVDDLLAHAGMTRHQVEDSGHWFSQRQIDRFHSKLSQYPDSQEIPRQAGRFSTSAERFGVLRQFALGLLNPMSVYLRIPRVSSAISRSATFEARKTAGNQVEIVTTPVVGVEEKPYQCQNRIGTFEAISKIFTGQYATVEHLECVHRGQRHCRYNVRWENPQYLRWRRFQAWYQLSGLPLIPLFFIFGTGVTPWALTVVWGAVFLLLSQAILRMEKTALTQTLHDQGDAARELIEEIDIRHSNALLIQEIGQMTAKLLDVDEIAATVMNVMARHSHFDRGMILLADETLSRLAFISGFGYNPEQAQVLKNTSFNLKKPGSRGMLVRAFNEQKPFLINDLAAVENDLSPNSAEFVKKLQVESFISVPIVYGDRSLGVLSVENIKKKKHLAQSEINLLMGVASQTAVSIENARSFRRIQDNEEKYRLLAENISDVIWILDIRTMKFLYFSPSVEKQRGYTPEEALACSLEETLAPDSLDLAMQTIAEELEKEKLLSADPLRSRTLEVDVYHKDGSLLPTEITASFVRDEHGDPIQILGVMRNISERKNAEADKLKLRLQLMQAQKMETIGRLAGGVAHDLNNILSGLVSYPDLLLMDLPANSPFRKPIETIKQSGEKAATIVQDLLTLARRGVSVKEVVHLNQVIEAYLQSPEFEKLQSYHHRVHVATYLAPDLMNIVGSPVHISKTVMNLLSNAAEAMPEGGRVTVRTENRYMDMPVRGYDDIQEGEYVMLSISDTGIGISEEDLEKIFEPFYTKKVMGRSGTGLGMAVVWGTVKDHGGYIDVCSGIGDGTTFTLYFPVTREALLNDTATPSVDMLKGRGETVLVVDDVEEQRNIACEMLTKLGYRVEAVGSGEEAMIFLVEKTVDLVVLDMIMDPGMDGLQTYRKITALRPGQRAIIASGFSETGRVREAQKLGAGAYVRKPYTLETIAMAVKKTLAD